jgi:putative SOS response-associated peptidase YedK
MCGRYQLGLAGKNKLFGYRFKVDEQQTLTLKDNYNIAPSQTMPVIVKHSPNSICMMKWGLIPSWSKDGKSMVINARAETLSEKPMFKNLLKTKRCLIPATGFYEWKKTNDGKQPFYISLKNHELFGFAGLYDIWINPKGEKVFSYTIITCPPNKIMSEIHFRMPVIIEKDNEDRWLDPNNSDESKLLIYLKSYNDDQMVAYPISNKINSPSYNNFDLDKPIKSTFFR